MIAAVFDLSDNNGQTYCAKHVECQVLYVQYNIFWF